MNSLTTNATGGGTGTARNTKSAGAIVIDPWANVYNSQQYNIMVVQQRHALNWGLPKGHIEKEDDDNIYATALRELLEETGYNISALRDNIDYVPTNKHILFGHHFTSIAGAAPIIGPCIAVYWGWLPAILWVVLGTVFMGATHDFSALVISLKEKGKSIADISSTTLNLSLIHI